MEESRRQGNFRKEPVDGKSLLKTKPGGKEEKFGKKTYLAVTEPSGRAAGREADWISIDLKNNTYKAG